MAAAKQLVVAKKKSFAKPAGAAPRPAAPKAAPAGPQDPPKAPGRRGRKPGAGLLAEGPSNERLDTVLKEISQEPAEKTHVEQWSQLECPYCGETFEIHVTSEDDGQTMIEDCHVCCRPISVHVHMEDDEIEVSAYRS